MGFFSTKWIVSSLVALFLLFVPSKRNECLLMMFGGMLSNTTCKILKRVFHHHQRPTEAKEKFQLVDPGMPSSHATALFFLASFIVFWIDFGLQLHTGNGDEMYDAQFYNMVLSSICANKVIQSLSPQIPGSSHSESESIGCIDVVRASRLVEIFVSLTLPTLAIWLSWRRVLKGKHTMAQVVVGGLLGILTGIGWFIIIRTFCLVEQVQAWRKASGFDASGSNGKEMLVILVTIFFSWAFLAFVGKAISGKASIKVA